MKTNLLIGNRNACGFDGNSSWLAGTLPLIRHRGLAGLGKTSRQLAYSVMLAFLALLLTAQAQDNLTNGLVGYWPFDEGAGSLIADQSGKGNNGTLLRGVPSTMWTQGHIGTALYFDGESAAYVRVPSSQSLQKFTNITFAAWVRCDDTEREAPIIAKEQGEGRSYWFGTCPSAVFGIWLGWTGQWVIGDRDNGFIIGGQWTHLVSVWDGVSLKHYQDGNYVAGGASFSGPIWIDDTFLAIGVNSAIDSVSFKGVIDEVRIYNRALSETEVKALYAYDGNQTNQLLRVITELVQKGAWCLSTNTQVHKVAASGTRALVTSNEWETCLLNLSDPAKPVLLGTCQPLFPPSKVELVGNLAYIASWEPAFLSTVEIFDFTSPTNPVLKGYYDTAGYAQDVKVVGSIAYVADSEAGLLILDVSNPAFPWRLGGYDTMGSVQIVQVAGHYAYIADGNWLVILDVSNPSSPRRVGVYEVAGGIQTISARGSRVYLCEGTGDLRILDVSNPASIQSLGTYRGWGNPAQAVAVSGRYLYLAKGTGGLHVLDASDPAKPTYLTGAWTSPAEDVALMGNYALVAGGNKGLIVYEVQQHLYPPLKSPIIAGGMMMLTWPFMEGTRLQMATNLAKPFWQDIPGSEGTNTVSLPMMEGATFFRLAIGPKQIQPPSGMIAWWSGDGNALDLAGTNHGTLMNGAGFADGMVGEAFVFDGVDDYVEIPDADLWALGTKDFTIELWARFNSIRQPVGMEMDFVFVGTSEGSGAVNKWAFDLRGGWIEFFVDSPTPPTVGFAQHPFSPAIDHWYHLAVSRLGSLYTIYVDGVVVSSENNADGIPNASASLTMGQFEGIGYRDGLLDEVSIYNRALTAAEIKAIYDAGSAGKLKPAR